MSDTHRAPVLRPVDRLEILVLVDNRTDSLSSVPEGATTEWKNLMKAGMRQISGACQCCANHGLSLIVTAHRDGVARTAMFDAGPVAFAVDYNGSRLGTRFEEVGAIVLSHGHWDHAGGLPMALDLITRERERPAVPVYLHPGMFRQRALPVPGGGLLPIFEIPTPDELASHGGEPIVTTEPTTILDGCFYVSGEIPRNTSYEKGFPGHKRRSENGEDWEDDPLLMDERFLAVHVAGKGARCLLRLLACRHRQRARLCPRDLPRGAAARGDRRFPSLRRQREDHPRDRRRFRPLRPRLDPARPLHRLARGGRAGARLRRQGRADGRRHVVRSLTIFLQ